MDHKFALSGLAEGSQQSESCLCPVSKSELVDLEIIEDRVILPITQIAVNAPESIQLFSTADGQPKVCRLSFRRISVGSKGKRKFLTTWRTRRTLRFWLLWTWPQTMWVTSSLGKTRMRFTLRSTSTCSNVEFHQQVRRFWCIRMQRELLENSSQNRGHSFLSLSGDPIRSNTSRQEVPRDVSEGWRRASQSWEPTCQSVGLILNLHMSRFRPPSHTCRCATTISVRHLVPALVLWRMHVVGDCPNQHLLCLYNCHGWVTRFSETVGSKRNETDWSSLFTLWDISWTSCAREGTFGWGSYLDSVYS